VTPEQKDLCLGLVGSDGKQRVSDADFLRRFPAAVEDGKLALTLLQDAYQARDSESLQCAMVVGFSFGFDPRHLDILMRLVDEPWHVSHEDVVSALDELRSPRAVNALFRATQWIPQHLAFDDARALAVKAIWGLGNLPGAEAEACLTQLADSPNDIIRDNAKQQLQRRTS
jgi:hypothetical protein